MGVTLTSEDARQRRRWRAEGVAKLLVGAGDEARALWAQALEGLRVGSGAWIRAQLEFARAEAMAGLSDDAEARMRGLLQVAEACGRPQPVASRELSRVPVRRSGLAVL